ncbi:hypothetical protein [Agrococcus sp. HG114]|uniref:hypothetical protein n=1 Tax=Agrococcus sp. HG114 TaxID=2969757 RepID=UPI00215B2619|nr:hypothetical protein [Agrococcus sp. HG114]MCR8671153.1 hypothetical protein [Agrococcus sp. HG114]
MPSRRPSRRTQPHVPLDVDRVMRGVARIERRGGAEWHVQPMSAAAAAKDYVCPGCGGAVQRGTAHVVVWRADSIFGERAIEDRRHWHTGCWRAG